MHARPGPDSYRFGTHELQVRQRQLLREGAPLRVGTRAFDLLLALVERHDRVVGADELRDIVWPGRDVQDNNLRVQLTKLRQLVGPQAIVHHAGRGWRFALPLAGAADSDATDADAAAALPGNLHEAPEPLFGRDADLQRLAAALQPGARVTLAGPAGVGKTALALSAAHGARTAHPDGVWWVELAALDERARLPQTVGQALQLKPADAVSAQRLAAALSGRHLLLVLDNCEHLPAAVTELADALLRGAPTVSVLATSRRPLQCAGEQLERLAPLALPEDATLAAGRRSGAVALFDARARRADARFRLTEANVAAVADICRQLDGLPLALTLAAARVPLLGVAGLRARLDDRLRLLVAPDREQALLAALDWSHGLLNAAEQAVLRRLGVFAGTFSLDAVQALAGDAELDHWAVLDALDGLIHHSLLSADSLTLHDATAATPRYALHETVRVYARAKLEASGELDALRERHAAHVLQLAEGGSPAALDRPLLPDRDHGNLRAALDWATAHDIGLALRLAAAAGTFWRMRGHHLEGRQTGARLLAHPGAAAHPAEQGRLLLILCAIAFEQNDQAGLVTLSEAAQAVAWPPGHDREQALALAWQATYHAVRDELVEARALYGRVMRHYEAGGHLQGRIDTLNNLGCVCLQLGRLDEARGMLEEAVALARQADSRWSTAVATESLGELAYEEGDLGGALGCWDESLLLMRGMRHLHRVATLLHLQSHAHRRLGRLAESRACLDECLQISLQHGFDTLVADGLSSMAAWLAQRTPRADAEAAQLLHAAQALRRRAALPLTGPLRQAHPELEQLLRSRLDAATWERTRLAGDRLTPAQAWASAREAAAA